MAEGDGLLNGTRLSDIFNFPRKSFTLFHFTDRATWLPLALETLFWRVTGTIVGTLPSAQRRRARAILEQSVTRIGCASQASNRRFQVSEAADPTRIADVARTPA